MHPSNRTNHKRTAHKQAIGVFDSGIGGLTVLRSLQRKLPEERFLYLGDTARLPYGIKSRNTVIRYTQRALLTLMQHHIKMLVIACNTASALALPTLLSTNPEIPIIGVIEPTTKLACDRSRNQTIAILATESTVQANSYQQLIKSQRPQATVIAKSANVLVSLTEEGLGHHPVTKEILSYYLDPIFQATKKQPDCLVLGCTHFPILRAAIDSVINTHEYIRNDTTAINIIDSADATADYVASVLKNKQLLTDNQSSSDSPYVHFMVTDTPERFIRVARYFLPQTITPTQVELVDI